MNFGAALPVLETPRLRLRPFSLADAPGVQRLAGEKAVADTTLLIPHPYPDGAAESWIGTHPARWAAHQEMVLAITARPAGGLIGAIGLTIEEAHERAELGFWIGVPCWNQGFATEAVRAVLDHGFRTLGLNRIQAHHMQGNAASGRVMEKAGLRREGHSPQAVKKNGVFRDIVSYGVIRRDWW